MDGVVTDFDINISKELFEQPQNQIANESEVNFDNQERNYEKEILEFLKKVTYTSKEILIALKITWESRKLTTFLKKNPNVKIIPGKPAKYPRNDVMSPSLF